MLDSKSELKKRIEAKRAELTLRLKTAEADATEQGRILVEKLKTRITSLEAALKSNWEELTESAAAKFNELLKDE